MAYKIGDSVKFRVPGLHPPEPGHSHGVVTGEIVAMDDATKRVTVRCPNGHDHDVLEISLVPA